MKTVKLRKKEKASLLLLRIPVLRAASNTSPHARLSETGEVRLGSILSPHVEGLMKAFKLRKKQIASLASSCCESPSCELRRTRALTPG
jgi:hypothetical protein